MSYMNRNDASPLPEFGQPQVRSNTFWAINHSASVRMLTCLLLTLAIINSAEGKVIDEFTDGAVVLQASSYGGVTVLQTNLSPSAVIGGERYLYAGSVGASQLEIDSTAGVFFLRQRRVSAISR